MNFLDPGISEALWLLAAGLIAGHTLWLARRGRLMFLDPLYTFWAGFAICYLFQPLSHGGVFIDWQGKEVFGWTLFYSLLGAGCVVWGYEGRFGPRLGNLIPEFSPRLDQDKLRLAGLGLLALAFIGYHFLFKSAGGVWEWLSWGRGGTDYENVSGYVAELEKFLPMGLFLLAVNASLHPVSSLERALVWAAIGLGALWYLYLGSRSRLILVLVLAAAAYYLPRRRNPPLAGALAVFMALFVLTKFQEHYRHQFTHLSFHLEEIDMDEARALCLPGFLGGEKDAPRSHVSSGIDFNVAMSVVRLVPERVPFNYGWGFLEFFTRPIPRSVWPDKNYPSLESWQGVLREGGLSTARVRDRDLLMGPAFTFLAFWYYILGPLSVVLGGYYTGVLLRCIRQLLDRSATSEGNVVMYACLLPVGFSESAATPFNWIYDVPIVVLLPLALLLKLCAAREKAPDPAGALPAEAA